LPVFSVAFSAGGARLAVGTGSGEKPPGGFVKVWEFPSARLDSEFRADEGRVLGLAFTAFNVASTIAQTPTGFLVDRVSARLLIIGLALLPHLAVIVHSLSGRWFFSILPSDYTTANYREIFTHELTTSSIRNSLFYSSLSAMLDLVIGVTIAWLLTRRRIPFSGLLDALAMLPLALPGLVIAFGYVAGFDFKIAWLNPRENPTLLLVISYSVRRLPYILRSAFAGFQQTSVTLEEASASLGATAWRTLRKITLPLVMANLNAGTILTFSLAMLEVSDGLILAMKEKYFPITKMIWGIMGRIDPNAPSVACALGVVGMAILALSLLVAGKLLGRKMGHLFRP
jgi:iron(III) transport system permease protein